MEEQHNPLAELLRERNLKATATRLQVLSVIANYGNAIPYSGIQKDLESFDRVTLYRILHTLEDKGIIHKALIDESETFYALCSRNCTTHHHHHNHIHFKCTQCREVTCVPSSNDIQPSIPGHVIEYFTIEATGICAVCKGVA